MALFLWQKPSQICGQHFGQGLDPTQNTQHYLRPWKSISRSTSRQDAGSKISLNKEGFHVSLDVQHFAPEEISVMAVGNEIVIEGKHEEKQDEHGSISRHFMRRYILPEGHSSDDIVSSLSSDGQLTITAPKKKIPETQERVVPIKLTEAPHKPATAKEETKTPMQDSKPTQ